MKTEVAILHQEYPARIRDHVVSKLQHLVRFFEGTVSLRAVLQKCWWESMVIESEGCSLCNLGKRSSSGKTGEGLEYHLSRPEA